MFHCYHFLVVLTQICISTRRKGGGSHVADLRETQTYMRETQTYMKETQTYIRISSRKVCMPASILLGYIFVITTTFFWYY